MRSYWHGLYHEGDATGPDPGDEDDFEEEAELDEDEEEEDEEEDEDGESPEGSYCSHCYIYVAYDEASCPRCGKVLPAL